MKAISYHQYGTSDVLEFGELPRPKLAPGEVLIRVYSASVNPVDWKLMSGGLDALMETVFPVIPGWDVSGVVEAVGLDTPEFEPGDEVISYARKDFVHGGTFAEYVSVPARSVARKPAALDWDQAAGLPLAGLTAYQLLTRLGLSEGETVLIHGGAGGVGLMGIQIARSLGARVIATASATNHDFLARLGAVPVAYGDGLAERVKALAPDGVDVVADFVGGVLDVTTAVLSGNGRHASIADPGVGEAGGIQIWVRPVGSDLQKLAELADAGKLAVTVAETFELAQVAKAFELSQQGHVRGKIAIRVARGD